MGDKRLLAVIELTQNAKMAIGLPAFTLFPIQIGMQFPRPR